MGENMRGRHLRWAVALFAAAALALGGCSASPKSSYRNSQGTEVTVDWKDYPGHALQDPAEVLAAPVAEDLDERASKVLSAVEARLTAQFGLTWENGPDGQEPFHEQGGNGYGGASTYKVFNSVSRESLGVPQGKGSWRVAASTVGQTIAEYGFGAIEWDSLGPSRREENRKTFGSDDPDTYWRWSGQASNGAEWILVSLLDVDKDASGKAAKEHEGAGSYGWNPRAVSISYGATALREADKEAFLRALEPFKELDRPGPTMSD